MSKRLDVVKAVKKLLQQVFPGAEIKGLDEEAAFPDRIPANGLFIVRNSDPGAPEVDLCPLTYNYEHPIKVEIAKYRSNDLSADEVLDSVLADIGVAIEADRTLGGLCHWLEAEAPSIEDLHATGSQAAAVTELNIIASYSTSNPLT